MSKQNGMSKWFKYLAIIFIVTAFSVVIHEFGHFLAYKALGYSPRINLKYGYVSAYDASENPIPDTERPAFDRIITLTGGLAVTLILAICFTVLYSKYRGSFLLFAVAIVNSTLRFNMFIDGFNSDEGKISDALVHLTGDRTIIFIIPLAVWTLCIALASLLVSRQTFFKRTLWAVPLLAGVVGSFSVLAFRLLGLIVP